MYWVGSWDTGPLVPARGNDLYLCLGFPITGKRFGQDGLTGVCRSVVSDVGVCAVSLV